MSAEWIEWLNRHELKERVIVLKEWLNNNEFHYQSGVVQAELGYYESRLDEMELTNVPVIENKCFTSVYTQIKNKIL